MNRVTYLAFSTAIVLTPITAYSQTIGQQNFGVISNKLVGLPSGCNRVTVTPAPANGAYGSLFAYSKNDPAMDSVIERYLSDAGGNNAGQTLEFQFLSGAAQCGNSNFTTPLIIAASKPQQ